MARIRTIKPEFPQSESIGRLSRDARLLFIQLWTIVDDEGRSRAAPRMLASLLFPYDDDAPSLIGGWMDELEKGGFIRRYEVDGSNYLEVDNWKKHQKIEKPSGSKIPPFSEGSPTIPRDGGEPSAPRVRAPDLGPRTIGPSIPPSAGAQTAPPPDPDAELFRRGREVLGNGSGGQIAKLKAHFEGSIPKTRAAIEVASTKDSAAEYVGRILANAPRAPPNGGTSQPRNRAIAARENILERLNQNRDYPADADLP